MCFLEKKTEPFENRAFQASERSGVFVLFRDILKTRGYRLHFTVFWVHILTVRSVSVYRDTDETWMVQPAHKEGWIIEPHALYNPPDSIEIEEYEGKK